MSWWQGLPQWLDCSKTMKPCSHHWHYCETRTTSAKLTCSSNSTLSLFCFRWCLTKVRIFSLFKNNPQTHTLFCSLQNNSLFALLPVLITCLEKSNFLLKCMSWGIIMASFLWLAELLILDLGLSEKDRRDCLQSSAYQCTNGKYKKKKKKKVVIWYITRFSSRSSILWTCSAILQTLQCLKGSEPAEGGQRTCF